MFPAPREKNGPGRKELRVLDLGRADFRSTYGLQLETWERRMRGEIGDVLILVEHVPPVITLGRAARSEHLLAAPAVLGAVGIEVVETDRGGDVTYHGPGQVVGYPILDLNRHRKDLHWLLRSYEEVMLEVLAAYGVQGHRLPGLTGVWVGDNKIGAIGVAVRRWVTYHGFAFNVDPELGHFALIIPCGLRRYGVTSLRQILGAVPPMEEVKAKFVEVFARGFGFDVIRKGGNKP